MTTSATTPFPSPIQSTLSRASGHDNMNSEPSASTVVANIVLDAAISQEASVHGSAIPRSRDSLLSGVVARHIHNELKSILEPPSQQLDLLVQKISEIAIEEQAHRGTSTPISKESSVQNFSRNLLELSNHISPKTPNCHSLPQSYTRQLLLSSILPLYLRSSSQPLSKSLSNAIQLVWEHHVILSLNCLLDGELMIAIDEEDLQHLSPIDAARHVLEIDLSEVVIQSYKGVHIGRSHNRIAASSFSLNSNEREGYWTVASQWIQQREAISIPANLAVGAVSWQRLRGHWQEVSACIADGKPSETRLGSSSNTSRNTLNQISSNQSSQYSSKLNGNLTEKSDSTLINQLQSEIDTELRQDTTSNALKSAQEPVGHLLPEVIEIRSSNDPELAKNLEVHLQRCRDRSGSLALVVIRCKAKQIGETGSKGLSKGTLCKWQLDLINTLQASLEHRKMYGFYTTDGDLALIMEDVDRSEVTSIVRTVIEQEATLEDHETRLLDEGGLPLFSGIACVQSPTKSFRLSQLIESAWRCLDATLRQPPGSVKSIEVY